MRAEFGGGDLRGLRDYGTNPSNIERAMVNGGGVPVGASRDVEGVHKIAPHPYPSPRGEGNFFSVGRLPRVPLPRR